MDLKAGRVQIDYPCLWLYKVIGSDRDALSDALAEVIGSKMCHISVSNTSSSGKYVSFNVEVFVESEEKRNEIYMDLNAHPRIKIVL
jgi:putative lipoic acid-binding regulatory protein